MIAGCEPWLVTEVPDLIRGKSWTGLAIWRLWRARDGGGQSRIENLRELVQASRDFAITSGNPSLEAFLDSVALISGADEVGRSAGRWL